MSKEDMIKEAVEEAKAKAAKDAAEHPQEEAEETAKDMDQSETCTEEAEASEEAEKDDEGDEKESGKSFFGKKKKKDKKDEKIEELTDRLTRQMAEFDNFRKRTDREKSQMYEVGAKDVIDKILPVVDNFERGLGAVTEEEKEDPFVKGMEQIYKQLMTTLEGIGVKPIEAVGNEFDPDFHNVPRQCCETQYSKSSKLTAIDRRTDWKTVRKNRESAE